MNIKRILLLIVISVSVCSCQKDKVPPTSGTVLDIMQGDYNITTTEYHWSTAPISWSSSATINKLSDTYFSIAIGNANVKPTSSYILKGENIFNDSAYIRIQEGVHMSEEITFYFEEGKYTRRLTVDTPHVIGGMGDIQQEITIGIRK